LINTVYVAAGSNFKNKVTSNIGSLHNQGIEVAINWRPIVSKDFSWELGFNMTHNVSKIDELTQGKNTNYIIRHGGLAVGDSGSDGVMGWCVNQPVTAFYVYQQVYDENGLPIEGEFVDRDGNGVINSNDRYFYKKVDPDVILGLTSKIIFKNWDLGFSLRANLNNYVYNGVEAGSSNMSLSGLYSGNAWHNRPVMSVEKNWQNVTALDALSDYFIQNASFLKCDNITLGYSFNKLCGAPLSGRVYLTAQNVFTITKYKGLDPEVNGGYDGNIYPRPFVGILGLSLNF
jgi:iron complex outermembrane receptor protein